MLNRMNVIAPEPHERWFPLWICLVFPRGWADLAFHLPTQLRPHKPIRFSSTGWWQRWDAACWLAYGNSIPLYRTRKRQRKGRGGGLLQHQRSVDPHTGCVRMYDQIWILGRSVNNPSVLVLYGVVIELGLILILILTNSCHRKINTPARHSNQTSKIPKVQTSQIKLKTQIFILMYKTFFVGKTQSIPIDYNTFKWIFITGTVY